LEDKERREK